VAGSQTKGRANMQQQRVKTNSRPTLDPSSSRVQRIGFDCILSQTNLLCFDSWNNFVNIKNSVYLFKKIEKLCRLLLVLVNGVRIFKAHPPSFSSQYYMTQKLILNSYKHCLGKKIQ
jgi:hypothetical protein